jgi:exonuclease VII large subunit
MRRLRRTRETDLPPPPPVQFEPVNAPTNPGDPSRPSDEESISASAERARAELHEEIERVRRGVEQMLDEQNTPLNSDLRRELEEMEGDLRRYVKKRIRQSERRTEESLSRLEARTTALELRLAGFDAERRLTEWRIHTDTERMLDGLLQETRALADRLEGNQLSGR